MRRILVGSRCWETIESKMPPSHDPTIPNPPSCAFAPCGHPTPPQDDLIYISRQILDHVPPGEGEYLLIRDPYLILLERRGTYCNIIYWIAVPQLWAIACTYPDTTLPTLRFCAYAPCGEPMPASSDLIELARSILEHTPHHPGDAKYLLLRDRHIMVVQRTGSHHPILYWTTVPGLWARSVPMEQLLPQPPLNIPAQLLVNRP